jgi:hypothetical protein
MALQSYLNIPPLDPNNFTAQVRNLGGIGRTGTVTADTPYGEFARWLYVGVSGNISYVKWDGSTQVLNNIIAGVWHPILSVMVNSASTTATGLVWGS